jgi:hypothetical protein
VKRVVSRQMLLAGGYDWCRVLGDGPSPENGGDPALCNTPQKVAAQKVAAHLTGEEGTLCMWPRKGRAWAVR